MKKLTVLTVGDEYTQFLQEMQEHGVVHVQEDRKKSAADETLKELLSGYKRTYEMRKRLEKLLVDNHETISKEIVPEEDGEELLVRLEEHFKYEETLNQQRLATEKLRMQYQPWGGYDAEKVLSLEKAGWYLYLFTCTKQKFNPKWEEEYNLFIVSEQSVNIHFVVISDSSSQPDIEAEPFYLPKETPEELNRMLQETDKTIAAHRRMLLSEAKASIHALSDYALRLMDDINTRKILDTTGSYLENRVKALEGWVPAASYQETERWIADKGVYYEFSDPTPEDNPPVKLKNNRFARLFEVIGELYNLPVYGEIDLTPFFAPFFVLFFGLCLGDCGYGLLIFLATTLLKFKIKKGSAMRDIVSLAQWLGFGTVIFGFISGTFFGIELLKVNWPWLERFKAVMLDSNQLFTLALIIGVVQIIFGMIIKVFNISKQQGFAAALSTIGWLVLILGGGACYFLNTKGVNVKIALYIVCGVAGLLIFVLNNIRRNPLINIGSGLWDTYNMLTGLLGDVLSYIRLFALGISGAVLGLVFNDLAMSMSGSIPVVKQLIMIVILAFGHGVNFFIAVLGAFVHPMRLTFVEFYKNAGFEGGGKKYNPYKKLKQSN